MKEAEEEVAATESPADSTKTSEKNDGSSVTGSEEEKK